MSKRQTEEAIAQFCGITGASVKDAKKFLEKYKRADVAIDAYYNDPNAFASMNHSAKSSGPSTSKLNQLFDKYKEPEGDEIGIDGTIALCQDLGVDPEDAAMLPVAYELKSPRMGEWNRKGWTDGWKALNCDSISAMKAVVPRLRSKLASDPEYFKQVYNHTFNFARQEGQRSIGLDTAQAFWQLLLPLGLEGGALSHAKEVDEDDDVDMSEEEGWKDEYTQWWIDFLTEKGGKGVSKDTWQMVREFIRSIDANFEKYDETAAWPSAIDEFVEYARGRLRG